jgi:hypothetical protein
MFSEDEIQSKALELANAGVKQVTLRLGSKCPGRSVRRWPTGK